MSNITLQTFSTFVAKVQVLYVEFLYNFEAFVFLCITNLKQP